MAFGCRTILMDLPQVILFNKEYPYSRLSFQLLYHTIFSNNGPHKILVAAFHDQTMWNVGMT